MFILDLYLLETAKKNYQYIFAGIAIGITLYTYSLSYIIMPAFLIVWGIYSLYLKKVKIKQLFILLAIILIFALPLMYFLLVNMGVFSQTDLGIFTVPKLPEFRVGEVSITNITNKGFDSIYNIFAEGITVYYIDIPILIYGIITGIIECVKTLKKREYSFLALMTITFFTILIANLFVHVSTNNKANIMYLPILYFIAIGIDELIKSFRNKKIGCILIVCAYLAMFINFEIYYYTDYALRGHNRYEDSTISKIPEYLEEKGLENRQIYVLTTRSAEPYIYIALEKKISPYEIFDNNQKQALSISEKKSVYTHQVANYHFFDTNGIYEYWEDRVYFVDEKSENIISVLRQLEYKEERFEEFYIFY